MDDEIHSTRQRLLDAAEELILQHGFAATSLTMIVEEAGLTKGSFFYHFENKADLAHQLIERFAKTDREFLEDTMRRAEALSRDPLQQLLLFVGLLLETFGPQGEPPEGCLFASYSYEAELFDEQVHEISRDSMVLWRQTLLAKLRQVVECYPPRIPVDLESLADTVSVGFEGGFISARILEDPQAIAAHLEHVRNYFELLFCPPER